LLAAYDFASAFQISSSTYHPAELRRHIEFSRWRPQRRNSTSGFDLTVCTVSKTLRF